jgi:hypothetical protein
MYVEAWRSSVAMMYVYTDKFDFGRLNVYFTDDRVGIAFCVVPRGDEDLEPLAFMQALLSEGVAKVCRDAGKDAEVRVEGSRYPVMGTPAGWKAQIAPLLPFASRYTSLAGTGWDGKNIEERMQIR